MRAPTLISVATVLAVAFGNAAAQPQKIEEYRSSDWRGEITGAGALSQCDMTPDDRTLFLNAVQRGLDPMTYTSADIHVMLNSQFSAFMNSLWRAVGVDPSNPNYNASSTQATLSSRVETYGCGRKRWSADNDYDIIVVEYKKSPEARARDIAKRKDDGEDGTVAESWRPRLPDYLSPAGPDTTKEQAFDAADKRLTTDLFDVRDARAKAEAAYQDAKRSCGSAHCRAQARQRRTTEQARLDAEEAAAQGRYEEDLRAIARYYTDLYDR